MLEAHAYLCNLCTCKNCIFPECSHMTGKRYQYRCQDEIEIRLIGTVNDDD